MKSRRKGKVQAPELEVLETPLTAIERGIALHLVMQYIDYKMQQPEDIEAEIERLTRDRLSPKAEGQPG